MAELRSFIIGVSIAGAILLFAGLAFGVFGGSDNESPSVRLLGTPPATRTPAPPATRDPSLLTPVVPTPGSQLPTGATGAETPNSGAVGTTPPANTQQPTQEAIQTATPSPTLGIAPTAEPTAEPTATPSPTPPVNEVAIYVEAANQYTPGLVAQIEYLIGNTGAPSVEDEQWKSFTLESAQYVQSLAGGLASVPAPDCASSEHGVLVAAANQASAAASQVAAAVGASDAAAVTSAGAGLASARDSINSAVANVSAAIGSAC